MQLNPKFWGKDLSIQNSIWEDSAKDIQNMSIHNFSSFYVYEKYLIQVATPYIVQEK